MAWLVFLRPPGPVKEADVNKEPTLQGGGTACARPQGRGRAGTGAQARGGARVPTQLMALSLCQESLQP